MSIFHDEVEIEDFEYDEETETYYFPCPCGDKFEITKEDLENGEEIATCPSCSLIIKVIYDKQIQSMFLTEVLLNNPVLLPICQQQTPVLLMEPPAVWSHTWMRTLTR
ncbi:hypothetical protein JZ751_023560, partial [Albula glossodonta]